MLIVILFLKKKISQLDVHIPYRSGKLLISIFNCFHFTFVIKVLRNHFKFLHVLFVTSI